MLRKLTIMSLVITLVAAIGVGAALPTPAAAQSNAVVIPVWSSSTTGAITVTQPDTVGVLYYYWFARTSDQVQDFLDVSTFDVTINGVSVFETDEDGDAYWSDQIEDFTYGEQPVKRSQWNYTLPPLAPGQYSIRTEISISEAVDDGVAPSLFAAGVVHRTVNVITVTGQPSGEPFAAVPGVDDAPAATENNAAATDATADDDTPAAPAPTASAPAAAPEPDRLISEPAVGTFVKDAVAYWKPAENEFVAPMIVFHPGTTLWVFGMDPSRQFYQVLLDAAYIWVRVDTIVPTNDAVWNGTPLPNAIIQP